MYHRVLSCQLGRNIFGFVRTRTDRHGDLVDLHAHLRQYRGNRLRKSICIVASGNHHAYRGLHEPETTAQR